MRNPNLSLLSHSERTRDVLLLGIGKAFKKCAFMARAGRLSVCAHREEAEHAEVVSFLLAGNVRTSHPPSCAVFIKRVKNKIYCLSSKGDGIG